MTMSNPSGLAIKALHNNTECMLKFDDHLADICKKASKQLPVLERLGRFFYQTR